MPQFDWEREGYLFGESLAAQHVVVVVGDDATATATAALGIARSQAARRRVALGDLLGDAGPIRRLVHEEDPHGLVDSLRYGVSLNRIAHRVPEFGALEILPSGSESPEDAEIIGNPRWRRLVATFRDTDALLILAVRSTVPHVGYLIGLADGAVVVGAPADSPVPSALLLGRLGRPRARKLHYPVRPVKEPAPGATPGIFATARRLFAQRRVTASVGLGLATALAAAGIWLAARPLAGGHEPLWRRRQRDTASAAGAMPTTLNASMRVDSASGLVDSLAAIVPINPQDSAHAAAYAVSVATMNGVTGAIAEFQKSGALLPAATYGPVLFGAFPWYRVTAGAFATRAEAETLAVKLRAGGTLRAGAGEVITAPYAFLVDSTIAPEGVTATVRYWSEKGEPVYALRQPNGKVRLYAGAFETRQQAALLLERLRAAGILPVLVYRTGRVY